jgi:serine protease
MKRDALMPRFLSMAAAVLLVTMIPNCSRNYSKRNTQSDLTVFSRIDKAWTVSRGAGVTVAVLDWQFDPNSKAASKYVFSTSVVPGERMGDLKPWHGAWMVNIIHHIAPEAKIMPIIARSLKQKDYQEFLVQGIRYAADHGAVAVTNSMGPVNRSPALRDAIDYAELRGTIFVDVHPENDGSALDKFTPCLPGECDSRIIHVGIVSVPEHPIKPNPSRDIYTWPYDLDVGFEDGWGFSNGPPIVAGVIALLKSVNPALSPQNLRQLLIRTASEREGFKVLDAEAAVKEAASMKSPASP